LVDVVVAAVLPCLCLACPEPRCLVCPVSVVDKAASLQVLAVVVLLRAALVSLLSLASLRVVVLVPEVQVST
jgi:hypothetical protein